MPLRCLNPDGSSIHAFDFDDDEWLELGEFNRQHRHLRLPCCDALVSLKRSRLGTKFFAHKAVGDCITAPETENHLTLKKMAIEAARAAGWTASAEVAGATPDGEPWIADILAEKNGSKVAIEIQWSGQTPEETMRRQERYRASGVRGLWLLRQPGFPITKDLPAVCIGGDLSDGFIALLPRSRHMRASHRSLPEVWAQAFPMDGFLQAAFERRFQYGLKPDHAADLSIWTGNMDCWSCGCETKIIRQVQLSVLGQQFGLGIAEVERYGVLDSLVPHLSSIPGIGIIKRRYSRTMESNYASNGCAHCDALIGQHFEHQAERDNVPVMTLQVPVSVGWKAAMDDYGWDETWWVSPI